MRPSATVKKTNSKIHRFLQYQLVTFQTNQTERRTRRKIHRFIINVENDIIETAPKHQETPGTTKRKELEKKTTLQGTGVIYTRHYGAARAAGTR